MPQTTVAHFALAIGVQADSPVCTALGRPCPNWLAVRVSFPLENTISRYFSPSKETITAHAAATAKSWWRNAKETSGPFES
jgi:hypothetical protein